MRNLGFVDRLHDFLNRDDVFEILGDDGDWGGGGCWILAEALVEWLGPPADLVAMRLRGIPGAGKHLIIDHVMVKLGGRYIDYGGWKRRSDFSGQVVPFTPELQDEAEQSGIPHNHEKVMALIGKLNEEFGGTMPNKDDDIRELDLGENPGPRCEFCRQAECICEGVVGEEENPQAKTDEEAEDADPIDDEIFEGMARAFFVSAWSDKEDEEGRSGQYSGLDLMDVAPETSDEAYDEAEKVVGQIEKENKRDIVDLFEEACKDSDLDPEDLDTANEFGHYLGMQALGHGVSWEDDHAPLKFEVPSTEFIL